MSREVVLIRPRLKVDDGLFVEEELCYEHLGLAYCASHLRAAGRSVQIIDGAISQLSDEDIVKKALDQAPTLIGITVPFEFAMNRVGDLATSLRNQTECHITVGGHYPTAAPTSILNEWPAISSVVRHEGDVTVVELAHAIANATPLSTVAGLSFRAGKEVISNPKRDYCRDLNSMPTPARDLLPEVLKLSPVASVITSRGCYGACSFCSIHGFYLTTSESHWQFRSVDTIIDELSDLRETYDCNNFLFQDDMFIPNGRQGEARAEEFYTKLVERNLTIHYSISCRPDQVRYSTFSKLKASGLQSVFLGVESGSDSMLKRICKGFTVDTNERALTILSDLGVNVILGFIMFDRDSTIDEIRENLTFLYRNAGTYIRVHPFAKLIPYIGTKAYDTYLKDGDLTGQALQASYEFKDSCVARFYDAGNRHFIQWFNVLESMRKKVELVFVNRNTSKHITRNYRQLLMEINNGCIAYLLDILTITQETGENQKSLEIRDRLFKEKTLEWIQLMDLLQATEALET